MSTTDATTQASADTAPLAIRHQMGGAEWGMLLALSVLWGGSFFFTGVLVETLPTLTIVALRVAPAALALWIVVAVLRVPVPRSLAAWGALAVMGVLNNVIPFGLIVWGQQGITSGLAAILNAATPLFGVLVAGALLPDERLSGLRLAGVLTGFGGVAVLVGPEALAGAGTTLAGQVAVLGAALSYAFASVWGRRFRRLGVVPLMAATGQVTVSSSLMVPLALLADRPWTLPAPGAEAVAAVLGLALLSTALAYLLYFRVLERAGATNLMLVTLLIPVSALMLGALLLDEPVRSGHLLGMSVIAAGLALIDGRPVTALRRAFR